MILIIKGKKYDLAPLQNQPAWLIVPPSAIQAFRDLGIPLTCAEDGFTVLLRADLWKRLSQGL
jgi:hypothetical protein